MKTSVAKWLLILLCFSMAAAIGGGLYEHIVLVPLWSVSPPSSFSVIQPGTGVPLQRFWIPVHAAITVFIAVSLAVTWRERRLRRLLLTGFASYVAMRVWSGVFFIREMLEFQKGARGFSARSRAVRPSGELDLLVVVQRAVGRRVVPLLPACSVLAEATRGDGRLERVVAEPAGLQPQPG